MSLTAMDTFPLSPVDDLRSTFIGKTLNEVSTPVAIIDRAKAQHNCDLMLATVRELNVHFRAHVKTHKTTELTKMQVGADCKDVRLIVSTLTEVEYLLPLLLDYKRKDAKVNVLYGVPLGLGQVERLARIGEQLGQDSITVMIDHPSQLMEAAKFKTLTNFPIAIFIKVDCGTHRAGVNSGSVAMAGLVNELIALEAENKVSLTGFYSHAGHSYAGNSPSDAMNMLQHEISACQSAIQHISSASRTKKSPLTISVGASPTALSVQNITSTNTASSTSTDTIAKSLRDFLSQFTATPSASSSTNLISQSLELHAGVYPLLDMQQLAANARPIPSSPSSNPIALTILTQIHSLYPSSSRSTPTSPQPNQALIAAGCLALGREPCKSYQGWGVVANLPEETPEIIVSSISQEHGILSYADPTIADPLPLLYGQRLRVYPNHACIASAMYGFYLVVDSGVEKVDDRERIVDVWVKCRGW